MSETKLPLGAVRTADGQVVVPASKRADGSTRKAIRIRQGYVPQDEVPKYKTVAQRRREQEAKGNRDGVKTEADAVVDELPLAALSLETKKESPSSQSVETPPPALHGDPQQLKKQLTKINKLLKEIATLEKGEKEHTAQQKRKIERKQDLQQQRNQIIAELNGATVTKSSTSASGPRPKVAISL